MVFELKIVVNGKMEGGREKKWRELNENLKCLYMKRKLSFSYLNALLKLLGMLI